MSVRINNESTGLASKIFNYFFSPKGTTFKMRLLTENEIMLRSPKLSQENWLATLIRGQKTSKFYYS